MYLLFAIIVLISVLLIWFSPVQNFMNKCNQLEVIKIDSGVPGPCLGIIAGIHGNETAGPITLMRMIKSHDPLLKPKRGKIIIIPRANQCGLDQRIRWNPSGNIKELFRYDLNRKFNEYGGTNEKSDEITKIFRSCDLILDFHEGWGWYAQTKNSLGPTSLGSTIFGTSQPIATRVARTAVAKINEEIDPRKRFVQLFDESCEIPSTLSCYCEKSGKAHIVIETSGQNDIQPLAVRAEQIKKVIAVAKQELGM